MKIQVRSLAIALAIAVPLAVTATAQSSAAPINGTSIRAAGPALTMDVRYQARRGRVILILRTRAIPPMMRTGVIPPIVRIGAIQSIIHTIEPTATDITDPVVRPDRASAPLRQPPGPTCRLVRRIDKVLCAPEGLGPACKEVGADLRTIHDQITAVDDTPRIDDDIGAILPLLSELLLGSDWPRSS
ncbi:hypothetical protein ABH980_007423 [Bradyrhizobium ottawaense]